ncbi:MAG TPA: dTMP kinase [Hyphomicrobiaceae bacterium]|nr:dTMP kinase [Hyphomicrobiaceae bacterium]
MKKPRFVTFEGGEGAGKSTQVQNLIARLAGIDISAIATREPGGSPFAEKVRQFILDPATGQHPPLAEALLFSAARVDHIARTIRPALAAGNWVLCDRFADSTRAYQGAAGGIDATAIATLEGLVLGDCRPDLTIILDVPPGHGLARARSRAQITTPDAPPQSPDDPYEARDIAFHEALRQGFLAIAQSEPVRCAVIDGTQTETAVANDVWNVITTRLLSGAS